MHPEVAPVHIAQQATIRGFTILAAVAMSCAMFALLFAPRK